jgi:hypothetical protein
MTNDSEQNKVTENTFQKRLNTYVRLIHKLAGDKLNFKVSFHELGLKTGETKVTLNGEVKFDFVQAKKAET